MEYEYPFHTAFLLLSAAIVAIRMYNSGYADAKSGVSQTMEGEGSFRWIRPLLGIPTMLGYITYAVWPPLMAWSQLPFSIEMRWFGVLPFILGIALLVWVHKHLSGNFTGTVQIRPGGGVIQTGPYAYVRHPMYWSFLLIGVGIFFVTASWFLAGGFLLTIMAVMFVRLPTEEAELIKAYGDEYKEYMSKTGRFFPRLKSKS